jgi:DNA polymerase-1
MTIQDPNEDKRLFLLDAFALIYRAYFAFSGTKMVNSKGVNTSPVFGFAITLLDLLEREKPSHIAVVFDVGAETIRTAQFADYKANRAETPEDIRTAVPYIQRLIEGFKIPVIGLAGYEADDLIGTLAKKAELHGYTTYMVTPDKDYGQLVSDRIFMYKPGKQGNPAEVLGPKEICAKYGIERPEQVIDILGMWGDAVDNIPGIPGVGEKTAIKLVQEFGSVENLIANTAQLKGKLKENVEQFADQGLLSKKLATIITDAPINLDEAGLILEDPDRDLLKELFAELEFRTLSRRVLGEEVAVSQATPSPRPKQAANSDQMDLFGGGGITETGDAAQGSGLNYRTIESETHNYRLADSAEKRGQLLSELIAAPEVCFDTETTDLDTLDADIVGASFAIKEGEAWYVPFPEGNKEATAILMEFAQLWDDATKTIVGQNLKYDIGILSNYGIELKGRLYDTMLAHYLVQPDMRHGMDLLAETYLGYRTVSITELIGKKGKGQGNMRDVPVEKIKDYAAEDADITLRLKHVFDPMLDEAGARALFNDVEMPLVPVLSEMEREGIRLDSGALNVLSKELEGDIVTLLDEIQALAGVPFNLNSPRQLGEVLFDHLKIDPSAKKTGKTGQYATSEDVLQKLVNKHPIVAKMLDYRGLQKLKSTYVDVLPTLVNPRTGRIHTSFNQAVAATGRLSSNNPNLQNIPIRTERGREVRKAFVPRNEDFVLLSADYSQIELRVIASLSDDANMMEAFRLDQDIHAATAAKVFGVPLAEVSRDQRSKAKAVNFGIIYGQSAFGLAENLNISRTEAREIIDSYFAQYPGIRTYMDNCISKARERGYVETMLGRRRVLRDINSNNPTVRGFAERNAINAPIQGTAADMIKVAMIRVHKALNEQKLRSHLLLQVHDELVFDAHRAELDVLKPLVEDCMVNAIPLQVPVVVSMDTGLNWLEAH